MLICDSCGTLMEHGTIYDECQCGGTFVNATKCILCGNYFEENGNTVCNDCLEESVCVNDAISIGKMEPSDIQVNSFYASFLSFDKINEIIKSYVLENCNNIDLYAKRFCMQNKDAYSEFLDYNSRYKKEA